MRYQILPLETVALGTTICAAAYMLLFSVHLYLPDGGSGLFALNHYATGAIVAALISLLSMQSTNCRGTGTSANKIWLHGLRNLAAFLLVVLLHFNFKLWAQLVNPHLHDVAFQAIDDTFSPVLRMATLLASAFEPIKTFMPQAYHDVFVYMFFSTFVVLALNPKARQHCEELAVCIALILAIGGISYSFAPAWGPFIYGAGDDQSAILIQNAMADFQHQFNTSGGRYYEGSFFVAALAAMPSLHSAHALALWGYARRHVAWLGYIYLPCLVFIFCEAIAAKWHYLIDLIVGVAITWLCMLLAGKLCASDTRSSSGIPPDATAT